MHAHAHMFTSSVYRLTFRVFGRRILATSHATAGTYIHVYVCCTKYGKMHFLHFFVAFHFAALFEAALPESLLPLLLLIFKLTSTTAAGLMYAFTLQVFYFIRSCHLCGCCYAYCSCCCCYDDQ